MFLPAADALDVEDLAEIGIALVGNMHEVGLDESFWGRRANLEGFQDRFNFSEAGIYALDKTGWGWGRKK